MFRLTLFRQQLLLVVIVLAFELIPLGAMRLLLNHADDARIRGERSQEVTRQAQLLYSHIFSLSIALTNFGSTRNERFLQRYHMLRGTIADRLVAFEDACKPFPQDSDAIEGVQRATSRILKSMTSAEAAIMASTKEANLDDPVHIIGLVKLQKELSNNLDSLMAIAGQFGEYHHALEISEAEAGKKTRALTGQILTFGILLNTSIAVVMVIFFSRTITDRLRILTENASRLAQGVPLHSPIKGVDEISSLDQTFHAMVSALADAADKDRAVVDHNPIGLLTLNEQGVILKVNSKAADLFQTNADNLVGRSLLNFVAAMADDDSARTSFAILKEKASDRPIEMYGKRGAATFPCELSLSAFTRKSSQEFICNIQDVTERKELEKLKQEFVSVVSHDLRTPLTSIQASLSMLSGGLFGKLNEQGEKIARASELETQRLVRLIASLLDVARMEAGKIDLELSQCRLHDIVGRSVQSVSPLASERKIEILVPDQDLVFLADEERLIQVLVNLLSNAIKYSPSGSSIVISVITDSAPHTVEIRVADKGCGIPSEARKRIFRQIRTSVEQRS